MVSNYRAAWPPSTGSAATIKEVLDGKKCCLFMGCTPTPRALHFKVTNTTTEVIPDF